MLLLNTAIAAENGSDGESGPDSSNESMEHVDWYKTRDQDVWIRVVMKKQEI